MSDHSRRALITGAASLPVASIVGTTTAPAAAASDPIFRAIEDHRAAETAVNEALHICSKIEERERDASGEYELIENILGEEAAAADAYAFRADDYALELADRLIRTVPVSLAGLAAFVGYLRGMELAGQEEDLDIALGTIERAVLSLVKSPGASPGRFLPSSNES